MTIKDENYEDVYICYECFKDIDIKNYIKENGNCEHRCSICEKKIETVNSMDENVIRMTRALIRYNYPEYIYNGHWGGDIGASGLLTEENPIISIPKNLNKEDMETFHFVLENLVGGIDADHEIPLYAGYNDVGRDLFATSMKSDGSRLFKNLLSKLENTNYNELLGKYEKKFSNIIKKTEYKIEKGKVLFRARIGYDILIENSDEFDHELIKKIAYTGHKISAPPPKKAIPGRANREGISYFYLASDANTAIAEVRPHPGHYVTVAEFEINEDIKIVNLIKSKLFENSFSEKEMKEYILFKELSLEFEKPLTPDINNRYYLSQFISDIIRNLGFDGIMFNSSVSIGKNVVIFNKEKVSTRTTSNELYKILKQTFRIGKVNHNKDYFMDRYDEVVSE